MSMHEIDESKPTLNVESEAGRQHVQDELYQMMQSEGWQFLTQEFTRMIKECDEDINEIGKNEVVYSRRDLAILEKRYIKALLDYPRNMIDQLTLSTQNNLAKEDPYVAPEDDDQPQILDNE